MHYSDRKPYVKPEFVEYGRIEEITSTKSWHAANDWLGEFDYQGRPIRSTFDYVRHVPGGTHEEGSSCANGKPLQAAAAEPARQSSAHARIWREKKLPTTRILSL